MSTIPALLIRRRLGRETWGAPKAFGPDGWYFPNIRENGGILVSNSPCPDPYSDGGDWWHASISFSDRIPTYEELAKMHQAVWPDGWSYQLFAPPASHVNIHPNALHLWGRPDGKQELPNFGIWGTI